MKKYMTKIILAMMLFTLSQSAYACDASIAGPAVSAAAQSTFSVISNDGKHFTISPQEAQYLSGYQWHKDHQQNTFDFSYEKCGDTLHTQDALSAFIPTLRCLAAQEYADKKSTEKGTLEEFITAFTNSDPTIALDIYTLADYHNIEPILETANSILLLKEKYIKTLQSIQYEPSLEQYNMLALIAKKGLSTDNIYANTHALELFAYLVTKNQDTDQALNETIAATQQEAITAACLYAPNKTSMVGNAAFTLLKTLVAQKQGFPEAIAVAQSSATIGAKRLDYRIHYQALQLFAELAKNNQGIPEAIAAAHHGTTSPDSLIHEDSLKLLIILVDNDQGFAHATLAAQRDIENKSETIQKYALELLQHLVIKHQAVKFAMVAAQIGSQSKSSTIKFHAGQLKKLIAQELGVAAAAPKALQKKAFFKKR